MQKIFFISLLFFNILILFSENKLFSMLQTEKRRDTEKIYKDPNFPKLTKTIPINKPKHSYLVQSMVWSQSPQNINYEK